MICKLELCLGSDDAVPPYFPSHVLGSRKDTQAAVSSGVYGTKNQQAAAVALSTIEERSVVVRVKVYVILQY